MKQSEIKVGAVYRNAGRGTTFRQVLAVGTEYRPEERFSSKKPDESAKGVLFRQIRKGHVVWSEQCTMWLDSFAGWAWAEVDWQGRL
jgi:hypothetical protein